MFEPSEHLWRERGLILNANLPSYHRVGASPLSLDVRYFLIAASVPTVLLGFDSWAWKIPWRRDRLPTPVFLGFPGGSAGKESGCNVGDLGLIPGLRRFPGEGGCYPLQYSSLENSMDDIVHGVAKS